MRWLELSIQVNRSEIEAATELLGRFAYGGVAIEEPLLPDVNGEEGVIDSTKPVLVKAYLRINKDLGRKKQRLRQGLSLLPSPHSAEDLRTREIFEEDWDKAWKAYFDVLRLGRIVIKPPWREYTPGPKDVVIELDPGLAFGTGLHPTTRRCLLELEQRLRPEMTVLDLGTGSGILAIAAAKLGAAAVLALDIDPVAVAAARRNVMANGVDHLVRVQEGSLYKKTSKQQRTLSHQNVPATLFNLIIANITADVISKLAEEVVDSLRTGGICILGGIIASRLEEVKSRLVRAGAFVEGIRADGEWQTIVAQTN